MDTDKIVFTAQEIADSGFEYHLRKQEFVIEKASVSTTWNGQEVTNKAKLILVGMLTGCGLAQLKGLAGVSKGCDKKEVLEVFEQVKTYTRKMGVGAIIATLGESFYLNKLHNTDLEGDENRHNLMIELGFEQISEYHNYIHGSQYKQRLYIIKL